MLRHFNRCINMSALRPLFVRGNMVMDRLCHPNRSHGILNMFLDSLVGYEWVRLQVRVDFCWACYW